MPSFHYTDRLGLPCAGHSCRQSTEISSSEQFGGEIITNICGAKPQHSKYYMWVLICDELITAQLWLAMVRWLLSSSSSLSPPSPWHPCWCCPPSSWSHSRGGVDHPLMSLRAENIPLYRGRGHRHNTMHAPDAGLLLVHSGVHGEWRLSTQGIHLD